MSAIYVVLRMMRRVSTEVKIVFITLTILLLLPTFAVVVLAASGASLIGDAVAYLNPVTRLVKLLEYAREANLLLSDFDREYWGIFSPFVARSDG